LGDPNLSAFIWSVADLSDDDQLVYVNDVIMGKLLESQTLQQQAVNNSKEQFGSSPTLTTGITDAIMDAMDAHTAMSRQALNSTEIREGIKEILLNYAGLWEALRVPLRSTLWRTTFAQNRSEGW
jgi:type I restriction enzyme R subunit